MIIRYPMGIMQANCYLVYDEQTHDGTIIDPGGDPYLLLEEVEKHTLHIQHILNTHGHFDHTAGNASLQFLNVPLAIHPADKDLLQTGGGATWFDLPFAPSPSPTLELHDGLILTIGTLRLQVIHIPGHSPGSVCFYLAQKHALFTGDTLFAGSVGRTDLPGGNTYQLNISLQRLLAFPPETRIYPGHGPESTLIKERQFNPWLQ
ncbi:MAG: MBL fold metallo-hydrolase [Anaerolineae bacterium]|nr:MBL fold metallo-hydrolase [Anaerolineae bacterium]